MQFRWCFFILNKIMEQGISQQIHFDAWYCDVPTPPRDLVSTSVTRVLQSFSLVLTINVIRIYTSSKSYPLCPSACLGQGPSAIALLMSLAGGPKTKHTSSFPPRSQKANPPAPHSFLLHCGVIRPALGRDGTLEATGARTPGIVIVLTPSPPRWQYCTKLIHIQLWKILLHDFISNEKTPSKLQYKKIIIF